MSIFRVTFKTCPSGPDQVAAIDIEDVRNYIKYETRGRILDVDHSKPDNLELITSLRAVVDADAPVDRSKALSALPRHVIARLVLLNSLRAGVLPDDAYLIADVVWCHILAGHLGFGDADESVNDLVSK